MYNQHFGLISAPFKITPDPHLFYSGGRRGEILEALVYSVTSGEGIIKVVGEVGAGKTMLCRMLEVRLPGNVETVYLANPSLSPEDILQAMALEMGLEAADPGNRLKTLQLIQQHLLEKHARNEHVVVLVEEAQSMPNATLEEIRLLSNLETGQSKLLQIVLFGQPELDEKLADPSIRQLRERITHSFTLSPLNSEEVKEYVNFRLRQVGYRGRDAFRRGAYKRIAKASLGLTRRVNILADKALLAAYAEDTHDVSRRHVLIAIKDSQYLARLKLRWPEFMLGAGATMLVLALGTFWSLRDQLGLSFGSDLESVASATAQPAPVTPAIAARPNGPVVASSGAQITPARQAGVANGAMEATVSQVPAAAAMIGTTANGTTGRTVTPASPPVKPALRSVAAQKTPQESSVTASVTAPAQPMAPAVKVRTDQLTLSASLMPPVAVATPAPRSEPQPQIVAAPAVGSATAQAPASQPKVVASSTTAVSVSPTQQGGAPVAAAVGKRDEAPAAQTLATAAKRLATPVVAATRSATAAPPTPGAGAAATTKTASTTPVVPSAQATQSQQPVQSVAKDLVGARLQVTKAWLNSVSGTSYSIQLLVTNVSRRKALEDFLRTRQRAGELEDVYVYETIINERNWFGVLYRSFSSFSEARRALSKLPRELSLHAPFIRNVRDISTLG